MVWFETNLESEAIIIITKIESTSKKGNCDIKLYAGLLPLYTKIHENLEERAKIAKEKDSLLQRSANIIEGKKTIVDALDVIYAKLRSTPTRDLEEKHAELKRKLTAVLKEQKGLTDIINSCTSRFLVLSKEGKTEKLLGLLQKIAHLISTVNPASL